MVLSVKCVSIEFYTNFMYDSDVTLTFHNLTVQYRTHSLISEFSIPVSLWYLSAKSQPCLHSFAYKSLQSGIGFSFLSAWPNPTVLHSHYQRRLPEWLYSSFLNSPQHGHYTIFSYHFTWCYVTIFLYFPFTHMPTVIVISRGQERSCLLLPLDSSRFIAQTWHICLVKSGTYSWFSLLS